MEVHLPARPEFVALARACVAEVAREAPGLPAERVEDLRVAVSEACTNAIEAHGAGGIGDDILVRCELSSRQLRVVVQDRGHGFDPSHLLLLPTSTDPNLLGAERGFGVPLMRLLADDVEIHSSPDGTSVAVTMRLDGRRQGKMGG